MQTVIQVLCGPGGSLRDAIAHDARLERYGLVVSEIKRSDRSRGWTKIHGLDDDAHGAINIQWIASASTLLCRVVTRSRDPGPIAGTLVGYLLSRYKRRIRALHVVPD